MLIPTLIHRSEIDVTRWDELITQSPQSVIYAQSFYLDIVCNEWSALVWPSATDYQILMPVPTRRKLGFRIAYLPLFCQYLGIFSRSELLESEADAFLHALSAHFCYISCYCFNPENTRTLMPLLHRQPSLQPAMLTTEWLDLNRQYECVNEGYSADRQTNLRRGSGLGWTVISMKNIHPLIKLFVQNHAENIPGGVNHKAYDILEKLFTILRDCGTAELRYAHKDGTIRAGALFIKNGGRVIYLFNAADEVGRAGNARTFLLDHYFRQHCEGNLLFDFESPEKESILNFYRSFGGTTIPFFRVTKNALPFPLKQIQNWRKKLCSEPFKIFS